MLENIEIRDVLFLDIETVPLYPDYEEQPENLKALWDKKSSYFRKSDEQASDVYQRAGIYSEFGKIICISVGMIHSKKELKFLRLKSFAGDDEKEILAGFSKMLNDLDTRRKPVLCAHNGKEFDFPYIARRILINGLKLPVSLDIAGKKPWETNMLDTMELWKFGDYKHYTSLDLLTTIFNIPSPKDKIDGSMVADYYWNKKDLESIVTYCQKDVVAIVQLMLRYKNEELIRDENIEIVK